MAKFKFRDENGNFVELGGKIDAIKVNGTEQTIVDKTVDIAIPDIIDNVSSTSTADGLSANMGKNLQEQINNLNARGRFLSKWDAATGLPTSYPTPSSYPYTYAYKTGDWYVISNVATSGYTHSISMSGTDYNSNAYNVVFSINNDVSTQYDNVQAIITALYNAGHTAYSGTCPATGSITDHETLEVRTLGYVAADGTSAILLQDSTTAMIGSVLSDATGQTITDTVTGGGSSTNYKPDGTSISKQDASSSWVIGSTTETEAVGVNDVYLFDGTNWLYQQNKVDLTIFVTDVAFDSTSNNITQTINGATTNVTPVVVSVNGNSGAIDLSNTYLGISAKAVDSDKLNGQSASYYATSSELIIGLSNKQDELVSGTNIKTIDGQSILGSGNIAIATPDNMVTTNTSQTISGGKTFTNESTLFRNDDGVTVAVQEGDLTDTNVKFAWLTTNDVCLEVTKNIAKIGIYDVPNSTIYALSLPITNGTLATTSDIHNPTITFTQGGTTKGTITLNQSSDQTIDLDSGSSGTVTDVQVNGTSVVSSGVANITGLQSQVQFVILGDDD